MGVAVPGPLRSPLAATPSPKLAVSTPVRPCARQRAKEAQDEINAAVEDQSLPCLQAAFTSRRRARRSPALFLVALRCFFPRPSEGPPCLRSPRSS